MNHIAGPYNGSELLQRCVVCGHIICDDRDRHRMIDMATGRPPTDLPKGFQEGPVYQSGNMTSIGRDERLPDCIP